MLVEYSHLGFKKPTASTAVIANSWESEIWQLETVHPASQQLSPKIMFTHSQWWLRELSGIVREGLRLCLMLWRISLDLSFHLFRELYHPLCTDFSSCVCIKCLPMLTTRWSAPYLVVSTRISIRTYRYLRKDDVNICTSIHQNMQRSLWTLASLETPCYEWNSRLVPILANHGCFGLSLHQHWPIRCRSVFEFVHYGVPDLEVRTDQLEYSLVDCPKSQTCCV